MSLSWASLVTQTVKNRPVMQETRVRSLGWADLLEKGMSTHSSILAWRIPWTELPGGLHTGHGHGVAKSQEPVLAYVYYNTSIRLIALCFFGGNDAEAETPILWPPHEKS